MARNTDHVVTRTDGDPKTMGIECLHCSAKLVLSLPVSISVMAATTKAFVREHARCPKQAPATAAPRCAKCGRAENEHNVRHVFVAARGA